METELKFRLTSTDVLAGLLEDTWLQQMVKMDSRVETRMVSHYYDCADMRLMRKSASLRIREEGESHVLSIKSDGQVKDGLHQRLEWSVSVQKDLLNNLDAGLDIGWIMQNVTSEGDPDERLQDVLAAIQGQSLIEICQVKFIRTSFDIEYGETRIELAVDVGELSAGLAAEPVVELELELKSGDLQDLLVFGEMLAAKFALVPEPLSKFARCLALKARQSK